MSADSQSTYQTRWTMVEQLHGKNPAAAWEWFVEHYRPYVRSILRAVLNASHQADEAENEFWGYLFLQDPLRRADRSRRFRTYLSGVTRNFAHAYRRKHSLPEGNEIQMHAPGTDEELAQRELSLWADTLVQLSMRKLRGEMPKAATAIEAFYGIGNSNGAEAGGPCSTSDIAARLQCSPTAVYQLLSRGRSRLKELMQRDFLEGCADATEMQAELAEVLGHLGQRHPGLVGFLRVAPS